MIPYHFPLHQPVAARKNSLHRGEYDSWGLVHPSGYAMRNREKEQEHREYFWHRTSFYQG